MHTQTTAKEVTGVRQHSTHGSPPRRILVAIMHATITGQQFCMGSVRVEQ